MADALDCHFITAVWGREYTQAYLDVSLPSQLAPGNLPGLRAPGRSAYKVYTTAEDAGAIRASDAWRRLEKTLPCELVLFDLEAFRGKKYAAQTELHKRAIEAAAKDRCAQVFLIPDGVYADGTFRSLERLARSYRVVLFNTIRVAKETFVPAARQAFPSADPNALAMPHRDMVRLALGHLHPMTKSLIWRTGRLNKWPSMLYWQVGDEGLLLRDFHLFPLYVRPHDWDARPASTVDDDYVQAAAPDPEEHYVPDSDELMGVEIVGRDYDMPEASPWGSNAFSVALWAKLNAKPSHMRFVEYSIRYHSGEVSPRWAEAQKASDEVLASVRAWMRLPRAFFSAVVFAWRVYRFVLKRLPSS